MSNIDKQARKEAIISRLASSFEPGSITDTQVDILSDAVDLINELFSCAEAAEERYEDTLRQARSFREAHDSAAEIIRKLERNKPTVKLPTTRLWAGKIACYEESEVVEMLERAGINIAVAGKGE